MSIFHNGNGIIVNAAGPGKLHLLTYGPESSHGVGSHNIVGYVETFASGVTRFLISHSHTYNRFAFYWEGNGEAVYGAGESLIRMPVARNWRAATCVERGASFFTVHDVRGEAAKATIRNGQITAFIIPEL